MEEFNTLFYQYVNEVSKYRSRYNEYFFQKYASTENDSDEIDLHSLKIVKNRGDLKKTTRKEFGYTTYYNCKSGKSVLTKLKKTVAACRNCIPRKCGNEKDDERELEQSKEVQSSIDNEIDSLLSAVSFEKCEKVPTCDILKNWPSKKLPSKKNRTPPKVNVLKSKHSKKLPSKTGDVLKPQDSRKLNVASNTELKNYNMKDCSVKLVRLNSDQVSTLTKAVQSLPKDCSVKLVKQNSDQVSTLTKAVQSLPKDCSMKLVKQNSKQVSTLTKTIQCLSKDCSVKLVKQYSKQVSTLTKPGQSLSLVTEIQSSPLLETNEVKMMHNSLKDLEILEASQSKNNLDQTCISSKNERNTNSNEYDSLVKKNKQNNTDTVEFDAKFKITDEAFSIAHLSNICSKITLSESFSKYHTFLPFYPKYCQVTSWKTSLIKIKRKKDLKQENKHVDKKNAPLAVEFSASNQIKIAHSHVPSCLMKKSANHKTGHTLKKQTFHSLS